MTTSPRTSKSAIFNG